MTPRKTAHYEYFTGDGDDAQHYWRLRARNGEIVAQSEGYETEEGALNGIQAAKDAAAEAAEGPPKAA